jgi:hypothetical protein
MPIISDRLVHSIDLENLLERLVRKQRRPSRMMGIHRLLVFALAVLFLADGTLCAALCAGEIAQSNESTVHAENCHSGSHNKSSSHQDHAKRDACVSCSLACLGAEPPVVVADVIMAHPAGAMPTALSRPLERPVAELPRGPPFPVKPTFLS